MASVFTNFNCVIRTYLGLDPFPPNKFYAFCCSGAQWTQIFRCHLKEIFQKVNHSPPRVLNSKALDNGKVFAWMLRKFVICHIHVDEVKNKNKRERERGIKKCNQDLHNVQKCNLSQHCSIHMDHIAYIDTNKRKFFYIKKIILNCTETIFRFLCFYKNKYPEPKPTKPSTGCIKITT